MRKLKKTITIDPEVYQKVVELAKQEKRSVSQMINLLLSEIFEAGLIPGTKPVL
jgi:predicted CopG family antitoxin